MRKILLAICLFCSAVFAQSQEVGIPIGATRIPVVAQSCGGSDKVSGVGAEGTVTCSADQGGGGLPAGLIVISLTTCPSGFSEVAALDAKFLLGTLAAHADVGDTGGQDTVTSVLDHTHAVNVSDSGHVHGELAPTSASAGALRLATDTNASGSVEAGLNTASATTGITATTDNPAGGVASIDNRPAFTKVIFCSKD